MADAIHVLGGAGSRLPIAMLVITSLCTVLAVVVSTFSIYLQLKNYRKPALQRMVIRIMIMVPIYAISSSIAIFSLEAAFFIDAIRDIYEAFVIYCFFTLLLSYLGGERSLLILLHGRPPQAPVFPVSLFKREIDVSDPHVFLFLKRGIMQYVQIKPVLAIATLILKVLGLYNEGTFKWNSGYLYISVVYNASIFLSLYCLAVFWMVTNSDLKSFRPMPKFLCVKGILFFSFWQAIAVSALVTAGVITKLGPYTDSEHISLALTDTLICIEMPMFAFAHMFAFSHHDFIDPHRGFVARMPMYYAFRDAFGLQDVIEDAKATLRGQGMDYRDFEPAEGYMHQGDGRDRRIRAGLRYTKGGKNKYWLPRPDEPPAGVAERLTNKAIKSVMGSSQTEEVHAPLLGIEAEDVVHLAPDLREEQEISIWGEPHATDGFDLPFGDIDDADEELFDHSRKYIFGDYYYPVIDVSSEYARGTMWDEEERILSNERSAWFSRNPGALHQAGKTVGYGAVSNTQPRPQSPGHGTIENQGKTIQFDRKGMPSGGPGDVKLTFNKIRTQYSRSNSGSGSSRSTPSGSPAVHSPSAKGWRGAHKAQSPASDAPPSNLPPDAVDLIVEDEEQAEEERMKERRKGEPAVHGAALRKVYRRGFVEQEEDGTVTEGQVEVESPNGSRTPGGPDQPVVGQPGRRDEQPSGRRDDRGEYPESNDNKNMYEQEEAALEAAEGVVAKVQTPPLHARVSLDDEHNPWA